MPAIAPVDEKVKVAPLLAIPPTVTTTGPVVALLGTGTTIEPAFQLEGPAVTPLKVTRLVPRDKPNPLPTIVIKVFAPPDEGDTLLTVGRTVNTIPLLNTPPTVITTGPDVAFAGTIAVTLELLQLVVLATTPLKVTVLEPWVLPKLVPEIATEVPVAPDVVPRFKMAGVTTNVPPVYPWPPILTTTGPVVPPSGTGTPILFMLQVVGDASTPLKVTVLAPCVSPRLDPLIVTSVPAGPDSGEIPEIVGTTTVKFRALLGAPPTVTSTGPLVAFPGTGTLIVVAFQLAGVAVVPLNVTVLVPWTDPKFDPVIVNELPTDPEDEEMLAMVEVILFQ